MRTNLMSMLDGIGLHSALGLTTCAQLYSDRTDLASNRAVPAAGGSGDVNGEHLRGVGQRCVDAVAHPGDDHGCAGEIAGEHDGREGEGVAPWDGLGAAGGGDLQDEVEGSGGLGAGAEDVAAVEEAAGAGDRFSVDRAGAGGRAGEPVRGDREVPFVLQPPAP
jgi:hypothetical protein